jgi:hypothetical protein
MECPQSSDDASNDFADEKLGAIKSDANSRRKRPVVLAKKRSKTFMMSLQNHEKYSIQILKLSDSLQWVPQNPYGKLHVNTELGEGVRIWQSSHSKARSGSLWFLEAQACVDFLKHMGLGLHFSGS